VSNASYLIGYFMVPVLILTVIVWFVVKAVQKGRKDKSAS
jgi:hypothetical protein